ncbi:chaperone NapD [Arvimicrobium flavum]|uniref:chaperone NapD n=1 Tax=Arvimicrobium flavum TaxID=3393320 RepID=UPI00237AACD5|nr:chaperone NapD [Mesorhizobium shangrilense]
MPDVERHHISSAVVTTLPERSTEVQRSIAAMDGVEVYAAENNKIVVVIEGPNTGALGDRLTRIALLDGVITANMVYEHIDELEVAET